MVIINYRCDDGDTFTLNPNKDKIVENRKGVHNSPEKAKQLGIKVNIGQMNLKIKYVIV
jgi:hypothetical protein